jgi:hypothetical protein
MTDIFDDLARLELPEAALMQTTTLTANHVAVRKPRKDEWFRVNPDPAMMRTFLIYEDSNNNNKPYIVMPAAYSVMEAVSRKRILYIAINRNNELFLSPVGVGDDAWSISARLGHQAAINAWIRLTSSRDRGEYVATAATFPNEPAWLPTTLNDLLRAAFGPAGVIMDVDHPICLNIRGICSPSPATAVMATVMPLNPTA